MVAIEFRLRKYLHNRILVFRRQAAENTRSRFDSADLRSEEFWSDHHPALLFVDLELKPESLLILGEAVELLPRQGKRTYLRDSGELNLVKCEIRLNGCSDELTFAKMIGVLSEVFLTKEELTEVSSAELVWDDR